MEITKQQFEEKLNLLCKENWKVNKIICDCGGFDNCPQNIKDLIDKELGITRSERLEWLE